MGDFSATDALPELEIILASLRAHFAAAGQAGCSMPVGRGVDESKLARLAARHGVTPVLHDELQKSEAREILPGLMEELQARRRAIAARNLLLSAELVRLAGAFDARGIHAIPYKGPVVAVQAWGELTLREFADLDFIAPHRELPAVHEQLAACGYRPRIAGLEARNIFASPVPGEYAYWDAARRIFVEIHTERTLRHFPRPPNVEKFLSRLQPVSLGGAVLHTFAAEETLVLLCVHGAKDFWERICWVADLAGLMKFHANLDAQIVREQAMQCGAERMLKVGLVLAERLLGAPVPSALQQVVRSEREAEEIAQKILRRIYFREEMVLGLWEQFEYRRKMVKGLGKGLRYVARLAMAPAEEDWEAAPFSRNREGIYSFLRPLRLLLRRHRATPA